MPLPPKPPVAQPTTNIIETAGPTLLAVGDVADGEFLKRVGSEIVGAAGGSGAPTTAQYVVMALDGTLSAERKLAVGAGLSLTDGGAGGNATLAATVRGTTGVHVSGGGGVVSWYEAGRVNGTAGTSASHSANVLRAVPFRAPARGCTIDQLAFNVTAGVAASNARIGAYRATSESNLYPGARIFDSGDISTVANGVKTHAPTPFTCTPGELIWIVHVGSAAPTLRTVPVGGLDAVVGTDATMGTLVGVGLSVAHTYGALPATFTAGATALTAAAPSLAVRCSA